MPILDAVRIALEKGIRKAIDDYKGWDIDHRRGKQMWRYDSEIDFWYGHIVGFLMTISYTSFKSTMGRLPNPEEEKEIQELIQVHGTEIREIVRNWK